MNGKNAGKSVRRRIFLSNALMVLATLLLFLALSLGTAKIYWESVEQQLLSSAETRIDPERLEEIVRDLTIRKNEFFLIFFADGALCIAGLLIVSQLFTGRLAAHIMKPLKALMDGAERIRKNDLTKEIEYAGDSEFETVCAAFNEMRRHILEEQEKNRKYEKARMDMIAGISHDLRTPLTAIRGTTKGLMDGVVSTPEQRQRFLETAYRRAGDMDRLLDQLMCLSKLETGNLPILALEADLAEFLDDYVEERRGLLRDAPVELKAEIEGWGIRAVFDPGQLRRILDNLLDNSMKYGEKNPLRITISLTQRKGTAWIRFADDGIGVPEEKLPYLFDRFYRVDESRSRKEGNGLGLSIVRYLAEAMGGSAEAENDGGLAVRIGLPVSEGKGGKADGSEKENPDRGRR